MTFFDLHPIDPHEARFKVIATLVLLSELDVIGFRRTDSAKARASDRARSLPPKRAARGDRGSCGRLGHVEIAFSKRVDRCADMRSIPGEAVRDHGSRIRCCRGPAASRPAAATG